MPTIKEVLKRMLKDGEFEKIINKAKGREKRNAKKFYEAIKDFEDKDFDNVPAIIFIQACKSWNIWQDLYTYMELMNNESKNAKKA